MSGKDNASQKADKVLTEFMREIHELTGLNKFILFGGTLLNYIREKIINYNDIDIAISSNEKILRERLKYNLKRNNFKIELERPYRIYKKEKIIMVFANNGKYFMDINFMKDCTKVGQFNIDSIYCEYPSMRIVDKFNSIESIRKNEIRCIRGIEKENPYILLSRIVYLSSKYNLDLNKKPQRYTLKKILKEIKLFRIINKDQRDAKISTYSLILRSILKSRKPDIFISQLIKTNILSVIFPEILDIKEVQLRNISNLSKDKADLIERISNRLSNKNKRIFLGRIKLFKYRVWSKEDIELMKNFKNKHLLSLSKRR